MDDDDKRFVVRVVSLLSWTDLGCGTTGRGGRGRVRWGWVSCWPLINQPTGGQSLTKRRMLHRARKLTDCDVKRSGGQSQEWRLKRGQLVGRRVGLFALERFEYYDFLTSFNDFENLNKITEKLFYLSVRGNIPFLGPFSWSVSQNFDHELLFAFLAISK